MHNFYENCIISPERFCIINNIIKYLLHLYSLNYKYFYSETLVEQLYYLNICKNTFKGYKPNNPHCILKSLVEKCGHF